MKGSDELNSWEIDKHGNVLVMLGDNELKLNRSEVNWLFDSLGFALMELDELDRSFGLADLVESTLHHWEVEG